MKITLLQRSIEWLAADKNRANAEEWIARCADSQLVVLPEMFTTGFCTAPNGSAERGEPTLGWMQQMASRYQVHLAGSVAVDIDSKNYNRLYVVAPDGSYVHYDKRHLFTFAGEHHHYTAGQRRVIVTIHGVRILLLVCYDLRFAVWSRNRGDYDMILCVANWPEARREPWDLLLRARAIENLSYVCGVNIVGSDPSANYSGGTAAIDFMGKVICRVEDNIEGAATFWLDLDALNAFRTKFPALDDADNFEILK
ncbi:MAG: amidohydrolase [Rikenellaceae bacterium]